MGVWLPLKVYLIVVVLLFGGLCVKEELMNPKTSQGKKLRAALGHHDFHEFLAEKSIEYELPYDDEVPMCDYRTMTTKRFYNDFVKQNRPCLFKEYGRT